jgi:hypothetical protein
MEVVEDSSLGYGTIMRFCQKPGCSGFQEFKVLLAQEMALPKAGDNFNESDRISMYGKKIAAKLVNTEKLIDRRVLLKVAEALNGAKRVLATGCACQAGVGPLKNSRIPNESVLEKVHRQLPASHKKKRPLKTLPFFEIFVTLSYTGLMK